MFDTEYSGNQLTKMSGVSARTLRYYDEIGLLKPKRTTSAGYRVYGQKEVDVLQQILFYKELGFPLEEIKKFLANPNFDRGQAFARHLTELQEKSKRLDALIHNVTKSMAAMKGEVEMTDHEKFEGFKQSSLNENERKYGAEIRERFGDAAVETSNAKWMGLSQEQYDESEKLRLAFEAMLKAAFESGNPAGEQAQRACELHRQWLCVFTPNYSREYHKGLSDMYVADERFRANYDQFGAGCTEFLRDAIQIYCG